MSKSLTNQIALVTGASRGIGYATARALAKKGAHVIAVARTVGGLEELDDEIRSFGASATLVPLDLTDMEGIDQLGKAIFEKWGKLDILVLNAGTLGVLSPLGHIEPKIWERVMTVNVTASWRLIRSLDPLLRNAKAARVLFITSHMSRSFKPYWGVYATSKAAMETLALTYAAETTSTNIKVNLLDPGPTRTALRRRAMPGEDTKKLQQPSQVADSLTELLKPECTNTATLFKIHLGCLEKSKTNDDQKWNTSQEECFAKEQRRNGTEEKARKRHTKQRGDQ
ncbi:MAG: SDR family NAD(P)-dependent oxidoreductase [Alphaproteobacteria bacterium]|nr:SDR family NAD(P)-dependent oxidoreductase [Alphaproteobacteria bacterium]